MTQGRVECGEDVPMEWTLEQARQRWSTMVRPVQHVGVPGYQFQCGVNWDGSLVFGPLALADLSVMQAEIAPLGNHKMHVSVAFGSPMRFVDRKGTGSREITRTLFQGRHPIPTVSTADGDLAWDQTVFAHLLDRRMQDGLDARRDDTLVVHSVFRVRNSGQARRTAHLWLHFGDVSSVTYGYKSAQKPEIAPPIACSYEAPYGVMGDQVRYVLPSPAKGQIRAHAEVTEAVGITGPVKSVLEWEVPLAAGEEAELRLLVPYGLVSRTSAARIAGLDSDRAFEEVASYWKKLQYGPGQIITPDPFVNDYLVAVTGQMAQQVARRVNTDVWMYKTSPNWYEQYWPCNAGKALPAFDFRGLTEINRKVLQSFIDEQTDDVRGMEKGAMGQEQGLKGEGYARIHGFLGNFRDWTANPLLLSHGMGMWALASHYRITRDRKWLGEGPGSPLQAMLDAFDWVSKQRQRTMREEGGKKVEHWGLLPAASAHDWLAGNTIFNDAYCIYGMSEIVRLLNEIRHPRAAELQKELRSYRQCLRDRYVEARDRARPLPLEDGSTIPFVPRLVQELDWAKPDWTYTGYGPLRAGAWGALDPGDELVDQALAYLMAGMPTGEGAMFSVQGSDIADINFADVSDPNARRHYLWRNFVEYETMWPIGGPLFLARDDLPHFFEWLFNNLAVVLHPDWRVGVESLDGVPSCAPGDGERWQQVRRMFVNERGGYDGSGQSLWLLQAIPRSWLRPGYRMEVRDMGTHFGGKVNLEVQVSETGDSVDVAAAWEGVAAEPTVIVLRLRSGDGRPLGSAEVNGKPVPVLEGDTIKLPVAASGKFHIVGRFGKAGRLASAAD